MKRGTGEMNHFHTHYSIGYIIKGGHYLCKNKSRFDYAIGDLRVINPYEIHSTNGENWRYINITIDTIKLHELVDDIEQNSNPYPLNFCTKIEKNKNISNLIFSYLQTIDSLDDSLEKEEIESRFLEILLKNYLKTKIKESKLIHTKKELNIAKEYIHTNFSDKNLTIETIAKNISLSPYYFARSFKKSFGLSPHRYIQNIRLENAYNMITQNRLPLSQIAQICGFSDQSHMIRVFKMYYGFTPTLLIKSK